jgi:ABC-type multidrug transport system fused ATPase/permease subunit
VQNRDADQRMKSKPVSFPVVVGLVADESALSAQVVEGIRNFLNRLGERSPAGVIAATTSFGETFSKLSSAVKEAGFALDTISSGADSAEIDLVDASDLILLISTAPSGNFDRAHESLVAFARSVGRPVLRMNARGVLLDQVPPQIPSEGGWLSELFEQAGLTPDDSLETIQERTDSLANRAAPVTRRWWKWILFLEGITVLVPLAWLVQRMVFVRIGWVAAVTFLTVLLLVAVNWWLRWRGMQKTWARARLVAEVARSLLSTAACPATRNAAVLAEVPSLRPLRWTARRAASPLPFPEWRQLYLEKRIDDQEKYFRNKQQQSEQQRKQLTRWATLLLDIALAFAFAGAVICLAPDARTWLRILGDFRLEIILGVAGAAMPLGLLLVQLLRGLQDVNRRTAGFAQQRQMLQRARARLSNLPSAPAAIQVVKETERQLLGEVLDWYFHAETAEHFFHLGERRDGRPGRKSPDESRPSTLAEPSRRILGRIGFAGLFLTRVVLGRIPWIVGSGAAALIWIFYFQPSDLKSKNEVRVLAELKGSDGETWNPSQERAKHGCVVIVHGLWGHSPFTKSKDNWMQQCAAAIEKRFGKDQAPNICLVDWNGVATPSKIFDIVGSPTVRWLQDIAAIRPEAYQVGDEVAFRLAQLALQNKKIRRDRPLYLIGHSAGGFVVARIAIALSKLNVAPSPLRVTILDTPAPDQEILFDLPRICPVDFYITSPFGGRTPELLLANFSLGGIHMKELSAPAGERAIDKHRWAYDWFKETITNPKKVAGEGFCRSGFCNPRPTVNPH